MGSEDVNGPGVRRGVQPVPEEVTQTLVSPGCERSPPFLVTNVGPVLPAPEFFFMTPIPKRQHAMVIGFVMLVAVFVAFVVVLHWVA